MKVERAVLGLALLHAAASPEAAIAQHATTSAAAIEPGAREVVRWACDYLQSLDRFSVAAEISYDEVLAAGYKLQYSRAGRLLVEKPNRFRFESDSDKGYRTAWYDGQSLTIYDEDLNVYATFDAPNTIDATLDLIADRGIVLPLDDLLYSQPWPAWASTCKADTTLG
jgi:hypothetical protein